MTDILKAIDDFATGLFSATNKSVWATLAGRALLVMLCLAIIYLVAILFRAPLVSKPLADDAPKGLVYALPATQFLVTAKLEILDCTATELEAAAAPVVDPFASEAAPPAGAPAPAATAAPSATTSATKRQGVLLTTRLKVDITPQTIADAGYRYVIPDTALHHPLLGDQLRAGLSAGGLLSSVGYSSRPLAEELKTTTETLIQLGSGLLNVPTATTGVPAAQDACRGLPTNAPAGTDTAGTVASGPKAANVLVFADTLNPARPTSSWVPNPGAAANKAVVDALATKKLTFQLTVPARPSKPAAETAGIVYRYPETGTVRACLGECDLSTTVKTEDVVALGSYPVYAPGQEASLPVERSWFGSHALTLTFDERGGLASYASTITEMPASALKPSSSQ